MGGKPAGGRAPHTTLSFRVDNIADAIARLAERGVNFADYDYPDLKTVDHVCVLGTEKAAWFEDTEGNILCLHEDVARTPAAAGLIGSHDVRGKTGICSRSTKVASFNTRTNRHLNVPPQPEIRSTLVQAVV